MKGVPLIEIQELGGWHSERMVKRYAHTDTKHLSRSAAEIDSVLESRGTITVQ